MLKKILWFLCLFLCSMLNLYMMHRFQAWEGIFELGGNDVSWARAWFSILLDVTVLFALSLPLTGFRLRGSLLLCFYLSLALALCNVLYGRFFHLYFSPLLLLEWRNASDSSLITTVLAGAQWKDLYFPLAGIVFFLIWRRSKDQVGAWIPSLAILYGFFGLFLAIAPKTSEDFLHNKSLTELYPNSTTFQIGLMRFFKAEWELLGTTTLSQERQEEIRAFCEDRRGRVSGRTAAPGIENLIFILVESYSTASCGLTVDGKEITPFLNGLRRKENVYFNGHMQENIVNGESSDGQIIYMTGLLPLRKGVTVSLARNNILPGLPAQAGYSPQQSRILVPTNPTLWQQEQMNIAYGLGSCYSYKTYPWEGEYFPYLEDPRVFSYAAQLDSASAKPFFSLVLTLSMHSPYTEPRCKDFTLADERLPEPYRNYLIDCHMTDQAIGEYFAHLEQSGLLDKSLVVITGDHAPHTPYLEMEGRVSEELPLYIVNGGFDPQSARQDTIQQVDVYTSILDILGSDAPWRGIGHSILSPDYTGISEDSWQVSEDIILSDYFHDNR